MSENCPLTLSGVDTLKTNHKNGEELSSSIAFQVFESQPLANGKKFRCKLYDGKDEIMGVITKDIVMKWGDETLENLTVVSVSKAVVTDLSQGQLACIVREASKVPGTFESFKKNAQNEEETKMDVVKEEEKIVAIDLPQAPQGSRVTPIRSLNPYMGRWSIRARVTSKGERRTWNNSRGSGSLFSTTLLDEAGTEIRATFFKEAAEKYFDAIVKDKVYMFTGGAIKVANRAYSSVNNQYEINFSGNTTVHKCEDDDKIMKIAFNFMKIENLPKIDQGRSVDVIGVVHKNGELGSITTKKGNELAKRELTIVDQGGKSVCLTLWGETAKRSDSDFENFPIVAVKGVRVNEYNGRRSLSVLQSSIFVLDPVDQKNEYEELRTWYDDEVVANSLAIAPLQEASVTPGRKRTRKLLSCIKEEGLGYGEKADWLTVKATVCIIRHTKRDGKLPMYPACPEEGTFVTCIRTMTTPQPSLTQHTQETTRNSSKVPTALGSAKQRKSRTPHQSTDTFFLFVLWTLPGRLGSPCLTIRPKRFSENPQTICLL